MTPGPWFAWTDKHGARVYDKRVWWDESGSRWGETPRLVISIESESPKADAALIAAAPEMLATLKRARQIIASEKGHRAWLEAVESVIKKAEGGMSHG
jgi:hypothetical protein